MLAMYAEKPAPCSLSGGLWLPISQLLRLEAVGKHGPAWA